MCDQLCLCLIFYCLDLHVRDQQQMYVHLKQLKVHIATVIY